MLRWLWVGPILVLLILYESAARSQARRYARSAGRDMNENEAALLFFLAFVCVSALSGLAYLVWAIWKRLGP